MFKTIHVHVFYNYTSKVFEPCFPTGCHKCRMAFPLLRVWFSDLLTIFSALTFQKVFQCIWPFYITYLLYFIETPYYLQLNQDAYIKKWFCLMYLKNLNGLMRCIYSLATYLAETNYVSAFCFTSPCESNDTQGF